MDIKKKNYYSSYETLPAYDEVVPHGSAVETIFLVDDSGSMAGCLWKDTSAALQAICAQRRDNKIDVHFLNHSDIYDITAAQDIVKIFQTVRPIGVTPTGRRLEEILKTYLQHYRKSPGTIKPTKVIIITDGEPSSGPDVESVIFMAAKTLDEVDAPACQLAIHFFLVGNATSVKEDFERLHNNLQKKSPRSIVTIHPSLHNLSYLFTELR
jgi:uncharacterized protein YegL